MSDTSPETKALASRLANLPRARFSARIERIVGTTLESSRLPAAVGDLCHVRPRSGPPVPAEVVGFREGRLVLMPLAETEGISPGSEVTLAHAASGVPVGDFLLGRVLNGLGNPIDSGPPLPKDAPTRPIYGPSPAPLSRPPVRVPLSLGVRCIDGLLTIGRGQRVGIFAGSGVGKSTLLSKMARESDADVNVIAMVGERGAEVRGFIDGPLGKKGLERSVVVVATSDTPAQLRFKGTFLAASIAEHFRDQGKSVLFMMDSVTRFAAALREIGLARGEPPAAKGYPPSLFTTLPKLVERLGNSDRGSVTGLLTVLVEGDDLNDPVADTMRSLLDGHIVLSRDLANRGHFPSIDVLASVSRAFSEVAAPAHRAAAQRFRELWASLVDNQDLVQIGAYRKGADATLDAALERAPRMQAFLRQASSERSTFAETLARLEAAAGGAAS